MNMNEQFDVTNVIPIGVDFKIEEKKYSIIFNYRMIIRISEIYGDISNALKEFSEGDIYETTVNFLYCGLRDKYNIKKSEIEGWIGLDLNKWRSLVYEVILKGYGNQLYNEESDSEVEENEGE